MTSSIMWMVRGDSGRLYDEFHERGLVALGWAQMSDARPGMSREQLADMYRAACPEYKPAQILSGASQVWRFINEVGEGDYVTTYNPSTRKYLIGQITGPARVEPQLESLGMIHTHKVKWVGEIDRDVLGIQTKNSLGSTLTLFRVPAPAMAEIIAGLKGAHTAIPAASDKLADIEEQTEARDLLSDVEARAVEFIKDRISKLDWDEMQELIAGILRAMGYKTRISPKGPDRGTDIMASPDGLGFEAPRIVVEVKHRSGKMGRKEISSFLSGRHKDDRGLYVSTGGYSKDARYEGERAGMPVTLWELDDVVRYLIDYYDNVDNETRQLVPLKRVYWPA